MPTNNRPYRLAHCGDIHLEEDRYFDDTARCLEWFVDDAIGANVDLFMIDGDLTTYKATIRERNLWIDMLVRMAGHAPVIVVAGNHGKELEGDLYVFSRAKGKHPILLSTEPDLIELDRAVVATFPYPRKADLVGSPQERTLQEAFVEQVEEFNRGFAQRAGRFHLFFGHFGVSGAKVSSGQPLAGRCAEYPLDPLVGLHAQYVGLSHIHLRQQLAPRVWYAGSLSRCDYSETEEKGYHLVTLKRPALDADLSDLGVAFRVSPTRSMMELQVRYEDGEFHLPSELDPTRLENSRVKVVVTVAKGVHHSLSRGAQNDLKSKLLAANPAELKLKIEHDPETEIQVAPVSVAKTAETKLRAYWELKGAPSQERQRRLVAKLGQIEAALAKQRSDQ